MSNTVLRLGFWILIASLVVYVVDTSFSNSPFAGLISLELITDVLMLSGLLIVIGVVLKIFDKNAVKATMHKNKCRVCGTAVPQGQIYCRPHLRGMLEREDRRTHSTRVR
jgi:predicted nucleic acid-binding Zn ribbon protein